MCVCVCVYAHVCVVFELNQRREIDATSMLEVEAELPRHCH